MNASTREVTLTGLEKNTEYKIMLFANIPQKEVEMRANPSL